MIEVLTLELHIALDLCDHQKSQVQQQHDLDYRLRTRTWPAGTCHPAWVCTATSGGSSWHHVTLEPLSIFDGWVNPVITHSATLSRKRT